MTIKQIENVLKGKFIMAEDKQYWENRLAELKQKEQTAKENEKYFRKMKVYDR